MRTLRQIPKVVGQTDAGETIYEVRSARLVLRGDAAHFNRMVRCSKCGREVPGRAVLSPADLDQAPQAVVCNDCVEAATQTSQRPGPPAEPIATDEPAVADAQAEMYTGRAVTVDEQGDDAEAAGVMESEEVEDGEVLDELDDVPPAEAEPPAVNLQLMDDLAGLVEDDLPVPDEDEAIVAHAALDAGDLTDDDAFAALVEDEPPAPDSERPLEADVRLAADEPPAAEDAELLMAGAGLLDDEPLGLEVHEPAMIADDLDANELPSAGLGLFDDDLPAPDEDEVLTAQAGPAESDPAPALADMRPGDGDLVRRIEALEERLAGVDHPDPLRLVAIEETVNRLADRADAQAGLQVAIEARLDELATGTTAAQAKKETDKLRRRLDQMGERLEQLQATTHAEWARARSETATVAQTMAELGDRVVRLAEQAGDTAGAEDERLAAVEQKVDETATRLASALEAQRRALEEGLREGLADVLSAVPPAAAPAAIDDHDPRFRALERQLQQSRGEVSELNELHAALDAGLGALRGEIGDVRTALSRVVDSKADLEDRLETFVRMSLVPEGDKGRKAKKTAESTLGTLSAAVQDLLREQRQLKDSFATLEHASDAATAAAARASMQASSLGPIRTDVKVLRQEIVEQQEALDDLRRAVERLREPPATPPPAAKPPAKNPAAAKASAPPGRAAAPAKRAAAKAPTARGRGAATAVNVPTAGKRAPRAKKA